MGGGIVKEKFTIGQRRQGSPRDDQAEGMWRMPSFNTTYFGHWGSRLGLTLIAVTLCLATSVEATEIETLVAKLPRAYLGEFLWDGDKTVQNVVITFESVHALNDQNAEAVGCGAYDVDGRVTKIGVRMFVGLTDLAVEILEQSPQGNASFETDGSHRGHLSEDLQQIDAQWTTRASGLRGQLHLRATSSAVCAPATSL
jgi:hypothetical protein